jgi:hypothetical protein
MDAETAARRRTARRTLGLLALVCAAPVIASYVAYYWLHRSAHVNYGELEVTPAPAITGTVDGASWSLASLRGRWVLLVASERASTAACEGALYATRQARTIQNREQERIVRVLLLPSGAALPPKALLAEHPGLVVAEADPSQWTALDGGKDAIYVVDPLGNLVLRYPADPDIRGLAKDLERLLRASRIG